MTATDADMPVPPRRSLQPDPYAEDLDRLATAVVRGRGELDPEVRAAARDGDSVPAELAAYVEKVRRAPYKVVDRDVEELRAAGHSEEQIFELTVATAVGEGLRRIEAGLRALAAPDPAGPGA